MDLLRIKAFGFGIDIAEGRLDVEEIAERLLLERRRRAEVRVADDGLPVASVEDLQEVSNDETVDAIHRQRDRT